MFFEALGNIRYPAVMSSPEEVNAVGNLSRHHSDCGEFLVGIGGSTNINGFTNVKFSYQYIFQIPLVSYCGDGLLMIE